MGWFGRPPLNMNAVLEGARLMRAHYAQESKEVTVYSMRVVIRSELIHKGYQPNDIERAINYLLR